VEAGGDLQGGGRHVLTAPSVHPDAQERTSSGDHAAQPMIARLSTQGPQRPGSPLVPAAAVARAGRRDSVQCEVRAFAARWLAASGSAARSRRVVRQADVDQLGDVPASECACGVSRLTVGARPTAP